MAATLLAQAAPGVTLHLYSMAGDARDFAVLGGDLLGVELGHPGENGDLVLATIADPATGAAETFLGRLQFPWLSRNTATGNPISLDDAAASVAVLGRVRAILRRPDLPR